MAEQNYYFVIHDWFMTDLGLKGSERDVFAIIYGFSRDGINRFFGTQKNIAKFAHFNRPTINIAIQNLLNKEYINKEVQRDETGYYVNFEKINAVRKSNKEVFENQTDSVRKSNKEVFENRTDSVRKSNTINIYKHNNKHSNNSSMSDSVQKIGNYWNDYVQGTLIKPIIKLTPHTKRYESLNARCNEYGYDKVIEAIGKIKNSDFLQGKNNKGWVITFDWFVLPNNFPKVLEGNYDNHQASSSSGRYEY
ncbi:hypothetical protein [Eubacterium sp.]